MNTNVLNNKALHIEQQLSRLTPVHKMSNSMKICCPFHQDATPSLRVWYKSGIASCYGCSWKGTYDDIAKARALEPYVNDPLKPLNASVSIFKPEDEETDPYKALDDFVLTQLPEGKKWRGLKTNLLSAVGCRVMTHKEYGTKYIFMPVYVNKELRGYSRARFKKVEGKPTYILLKGKWASSSGLFPFDYAIRLMRKLNSTKMVLVEGQRDALRLLQEGIPAVCFFGINGWTDKKTRLLEVAGVETAILLPDGDPAGIECMDKLVPLIEKRLEVAPVRLWKMKGNPYPAYMKAKESEKKKLKSTLWDPCSMPISVVERLRNKFFRSESE